MWKDKECVEQVRQRCVLWIFHFFSHHLQARQCCSRDKQPSLLQPVRNEETRQSVCSFCKHPMGVLRALVYQCARTICVISVWNLHYPNKYFMINLPHARQWYSPFSGCPLTVAHKTRWNCKTHLSLLYIPLQACILQNRDNLPHGCMWLRLYTGTKQKNVNIMFLVRVCTQNNVQEVHDSLQLHMKIQQQITLIRDRCPSRTNICITSFISSKV